MYHCFQSGELQGQSICCKPSEIHPATCRTHLVCEIVVSLSLEHGQLLAFDNFDLLIGSEVGSVDRVDVVSVTRSCKREEEKGSEC